MVFLQVAALLLLVWSIGACLLWSRTAWLRLVLPWLSGALALATVVAFGYGAWGLVRDGDWQALSTGQALHRLFGEGSLALRRSEWAALNRAVGVYLNLDVGWTLLALCVAQFHAWLFWSELAERRRHARVRASRN